MLLLLLLFMMRLLLRVVYHFYSLCCGCGCLGSCQLLPTPLCRVGAFVAIVRQGSILLRQMQQSICKHCSMCRGCAWVYCYALSAGVATVPARCRNDRARIALAASTWPAQPGPIDLIGSTWPHRLSRVTLA